MKWEEFENYYRLSNKIDKLGEEIFLYIIKHCKCLLSYGNYSDYVSCKTENGTDFYITYCDRCNYDYDTICVPLKQICEDTWKEYFNKLAKETEEAEEKSRLAEEEAELNEERKLYEKLKKKFDGK